jgi:hypothetical protein
VTSSVYVGHSAQDLVDSQNIQRPLGVDQNVIPIRQDCRNETLIEVGWRQEAHRKHLKDTPAF